LKDDILGTHIDDIDYRNDTGAGNANLNVPMNAEYDDMKIDYKPEQGNDDAILQQLVHCWCYYNAARLQKELG
jgi:hypothetical protein